ncbi:lipopolysaccharide assembly protein LapB [uncultured Porphyromonas sp.]|uniref:tetratricopeptide repeat protein n=1 Tax=uncultured Porphyromonas sp. TaxID=159274 RepID=UPI002625E5EE|nr:tetratricopeptide repeat protein [uncultured Porphyromonas sp.]
MNALTRPLVALIIALTPLLLASAQSDEERETAYAGCVERYFDYYEAGRPDSAEVMLRQALELNPEAEGNFLLLGNLAELVVARGDSTEAVDLLSQAVSRQPAIPELRERRADLLIGIGRVETALADYDELVSKFPNSEIYRYKRVLAYEQMGLWSAAEGDLRKILAHNADAYLPRVKMAEVYERQGRPMEAEKLLSYLIEQQPAMAPAYRARARLLMRQGRKSDALADVREVIRRSGDRVDAEEYLLRAEIWMLYGEEKEAEEDLRQATEAGATPAEVAQAREEVRQIKHSLL